MKASIFAMMIALVALMASCGNKTTDDVSTEPVDTVEYEMREEAVPAPEEPYRDAEDVVIE
jgi:hypothetical protein